MANQIAPKYVIAAACRERNLEAPFAEYKFHPSRMWRFDLAWPNIKLAVEIEGGAFIAGRHTRGAGFEKDIEKYNAATLRGWRLLRFTHKMVNKSETLDLIETMIVKLNKAKARTQ